MKVIVDASYGDGMSPLSLISQKGLRVESHQNEPVEVIRASD